jgi:tetratricopeptide (TPR) repeat protein
MPEPKAPSSRLPSLLSVLVAFALGAGAMWLLGPSYRSPTPSSVTKAGPAESPGEEPPDVSKLPPADAAVTLANWNYDRQNWPHAIDHYQEAIAFGRDNPDVRTDLGNCFRFLDQPQKALEQYEIAQKQNPQHENSLLNQASLFAEVLHDNKRALAVGQEFMTRFPQSPGAATAQELIEKLQSAQTKNK